ncbi:hypothetical protein [Mycobacterium sp. E2479]|uniref:hypothetical protein n=1 Tax=Mycobacterium sp. E2479 TaxID=1834134 RepID=UPI0007FF9F28|nr:hypothetical protein [Mycobacterium sp. E2479]OBH61496.1 hypothetical protein A5686_19985 [Mycobacterium sp. E2479]
MKVSLSLLSVGWVAFGALAVPFVRPVAGPASAGLLHPAGYAGCALGASVTLPAAGVTFDYFSSETLVIITVEIIAGLALLVLALLVLALLVLALRGFRLEAVGIFTTRPHQEHQRLAALAAAGMIVVSCALMLWNSSAST